MLTLSMTKISIALLGLAWGSFVNAFVWRLHELETRKLTRRQRQELSFVKGRSMCTYCKHELGWYDLIPVASWVSLAGKCRYCRKAISPQYPAVEVLTSALFAWSYVAWPLGFEPFGWLMLATWLVMVIGFVALAVYDLRWMELPNNIVYPLIGLAVVQVVLRALIADDPSSVINELAGGFLGFLAIGGLFYALFQLSEGKWIGGGDVKLAFMIGPLVGGAVESFMVVFIASVIGTFMALPLMVKKSLKMNSRIPFGPLLLVSTVIVFLHSSQIIEWYTNILV